MCTTTDREDAVSETTKAALDEAIARHVADECEAGAIVTGYVLKASYTSAERMDDETTGYLGEYAEQQAYHTSLGLALLHLRDLKAEDDE